VGSAARENGTVDGGWVLRLVGGLLLTAGIVAWEVPAIQGAKRPIMRAIRALVSSLSLFLIVFALSYPHRERRGQSS
jgi:hypothetical protein